MLLHLVHKPLHWNTKSSKYFTLLYGTLIWDPDWGPQFGTQIWDPDLGGDMVPQFGTPIWDPDFLI
jgi:hypothetical protein